MAKQPKPSGDKGTRRTQSLPQRSSARTSGAKKRPTATTKTARTSSAGGGGGASAKPGTPPAGTTAKQGTAAKQGGSATKRAGSSGHGNETPGKRTGSSGSQGGASQSRRQSRDYNVRMSGMPLNVRFMLWIAGMAGALVLIFFGIVYFIAIDALDAEIHRSGAHQAENVASLGRVYAEYIENPHFVEAFLRDGGATAHLDEFYRNIRDELEDFAMRVGKSDYWDSVRSDGASVDDNLRPLYDDWPLGRRGTPRHDSLDSFRRDLILALVDIYDLSTMRDPDSMWSVEENADVSGLEFRYRPEQGVALVPAFEAYLLGPQAGDETAHLRTPQVRSRHIPIQSLPEEERDRFWDVRRIVIELLYGERSAERRIRVILREFYNERFVEDYVEPIVASEPIVGVRVHPHFRDARTIHGFWAGAEEFEADTGSRVDGFEGITLVEFNSEEHGSLMQFTAFFPLNVRVYDAEGGSSMESREYWAFVQLDRDHVMESRDNLVLLLFVIALISIVTGVCVSYFLASNVTKPINTLVEDVVVIARGDYRHRTRVRARDEIGVLARTIDLMTEGLQDAQVIARKAGEMEHDLSIAEEVVIHLLPESLPKIYGYDVYAFFNPSKDVGGDYYDFFEIDDEHVGMIVADVAGKGIPGALVMTMARTVIRMEATQTTSPRDTFVNSNRLIAQDIKRGMFVTAFYLVLNTQTGQMKAASAGHNPMIIWRAATGKCETVNPNGIALGFDKGPIFERTIKEETIQLYSGDRVVNYTDGVVEAMSPDGEEFEEERLIEIIESYPDANSNQLTNIIVQAVLDHQGRGEQHDDITIVTFKLH